MEKYATDGCGTTDPEKNGYANQETVSAGSTSAGYATPLGSLCRVLQFHPFTVRNKIVIADVPEHGNVLWHVRCDVGNMLAEAAHNPASLDGCGQLCQRRQRLNNAFCRQVARPGRVAVSL
ncbi:MAG: hypothetical protein BWX80_00858 [Candidatus Hydrogenedentes bacterium ADurb.Bin101]|nr:MAG: hypothetical protein BWX80_00858 [Candidatus Hydrogenedentes bacterium ADurb.Bin101]